MAYSQIIKAKKTRGSNKLIFSDDSEKTRLDEGIQKFYDFAKIFSIEQVMALGLALVI